MKCRLGVNVDHVATLRQARRGDLPSPIWAARVALKAGADGIVCHLREDRRHIQDEDLRTFRKILSSGLNLEMGAHPEIVRMACRVKPDQATLVPERRQELTTEGGLDLTRGEKRIRLAIDSLSKAGIRVSLFLDPNLQQIALAAGWQVPMIELHTGQYAQTRTISARQQEWKKLSRAVSFARSKRLAVAAGHGLDYQNVRSILKIPEIEELNIGFSIVALSIEVGFAEAVRRMARLVHQGARR